jgi:hypothetical protein
VLRASSNTVLLGRDWLTLDTELIGLVWRAAPALSLVHDVSDGSLETALREMAEWSGVASQVGGDRINPVPTCLFEDIADPDTVRFVLAGDHVPAFAEEVGVV